MVESCMTEKLNPRGREKCYVVMLDLMARANVSLVTKVGKVDVMGDGNNDHHFRRSGERTKVNTIAQHTNNGSRVCASHMIFFKGRRRESYQIIRNRNFNLVAVVLQSKSKLWMHREKKTRQFTRQSVPQRARTPRAHTQQPLFGTSDLSE